MKLVSKPVVHNGIFQIAAYYSEKVEWGTYAYGISS
jgi:hypothetical protein